MIDKLRDKITGGPAPDAPPGFPDGRSDRGDGSGSHLVPHEMPDGSIELRPSGSDPLAEPTAGNEAASRDAPDDHTVRRPETEREAYQRRSLRSSRYAGDAPEHGHAGRGGSIWDRVMDLVSVEPPMGAPSLDPMPADAGAALASMAGWNGGEMGFDSMQGVDRLVVSGPGSVDAMQFMSTPSATRGTPLQMEESESVYRSMDDTVHGLSFRRGPEDDVPDTAELSYRDPGVAESPGGAGLLGTADAPGDFDWTREM